MTIIIENPYEKFGPEWEPEGPADRFRQLLRDEGIGQIKAWRMVCDEKEWWTPERVEVRDFTRELFTPLMSLQLAEIIDFHRTANHRVARYRTADNEVKKCLLNPWTIIRGIRGYTLEHADAFAKAQNIPLDSLDRMAEVALLALRHILRGERFDKNRNYRQYAGDTYVLLKTVKTEFRYILGADGVKESPGAFELAIVDLKDTNRVTTVDVPKERPGMTPRWVSQEGITEIRYAKAEEAIAARSHSEFTGTEFTAYSPPPTLSPKQRDAYLAAFRDPMVILDAPPGYGKTRTIAEIVKTCEALRIPVAVGTFMGRAATRVSKELISLDVNVNKMKYKPNTLHSLLRINLDADDGIGMKIDNSRPGIFIIDEASMVSTTLFGLVVNLIPGDWNIVVMGDSQQLPPIDAGSPFIDLVNGSNLDIITLDKCFRTDQPDIQVALTNIRERGVPDSTDNFRIYKAKREDAITKVMAIIRETARDLECSPLDLLITAPQNGVSKNRASYLTGLVTTNELNRELKKELNPVGWINSGRKWWVPILGDRVLAVKSNKGDVSANAAHNNGSIQRAFNGEMGTIVEAELNGPVIVQWDGNPIPAVYTQEEAFSDERILNLGYAVSVHKVQGAEAIGAVFIADGNSWYGLLTNSLTYTACSRGKRRVVVISLKSDKNRDGFGGGILNSDNKRRTLLPFYLNGQIT
jgi:exodeoxyribonuclease V alpha subunit